MNLLLAPADALAAFGGLTTQLPSQAPANEGFVGVEGARLWYWDTGGPGPTVLLLHPASGSAEFYPYQQPVFAAAGYRVVAYSRRGQFRSETQPDDGRSFAMDDALAVLDHLGVPACHVIGNGRGGFIALDLALAAPQRVCSLVLVCSLMGIADPAFAQALQALRPAAFDALPMEVKELGPSYRAANPAGVAEWKARHARSGTRYPVRLRRTFTWEALREVQAPALLITGDADLWMPPALLAEAAAHFPDARLCVLPHAGHSVQWEQPALFNAAVLGFIGAARAV